MGKRIYQDELIERLDPRGTPYYWIGGPPPSGLAEPGTDFDAVVNKRIAVTPIQLDLTARRMLSRLNSWSRDCRPGCLRSRQTSRANHEGGMNASGEIVVAQAEPKAERR